MKHILIVFIITLFCSTSYAQSRSSGSGSSGGGAATSINFGTAALTGTVPIANGGTAQTAVISAPAASTWSGWDANVNHSANSYIEGYRTTATAAGTTTLVVGDAQQQFFTGSTTQTVKLPVTSTLVLGQQYTITNNSTGVVTLQSSGANTIQAMAANTRIRAVAILTSGTGTASWEWEYTRLESLALPLAMGGTATTTAFTAGSVVFAGTSGVYTQDNASLFFDDTNNRLGILQAVPLHALDVAGTAAIGTAATTLPNAAVAGIYLWSSGTPLNPIVTMGRAGNTANKRLWDFGITADAQFQFRAAADNYSAAQPWLTAAGGSGGITNVTFNQGPVTMSNYGVGTATFDSSGNITSVSDVRLKNVQGYFTRGLESLVGIKPINYKWNKKSGMDTKDTYTGFSAQNVGESIPEAVALNKQGYYSFSDRAVIAALVNAVNELNAKVERLENGNH